MLFGHKQNLMKAVALLCALSWAEGQLTGSQDCSPTGPSYAVALEGNSFLSNSLPLRVFAEGAWQDSWILVGSSNVSGQDALGGFVGTECVYAIAAAPTQAFITTALLTYSDRSTVRFKYSLPSGAVQSNHSAPAPATHSTITNFPAFNSTVPLSNIITWHESFVSPDTSMASAYGMRGGPVLFFGGDVSGPVVVLSPLDSFLSSALGDSTQNGACGSSAPGCWTAGVAASFQSLPPGFQQSFILVSGHGITATLAAWGGLMRGFYGATSSKIDDLSLSTLGYQTDNGAQLCFGCHGPLDACLLNEKAYLDSINVPIQYLSFQVMRDALRCASDLDHLMHILILQNAWWQMGNQSAPWCVGSWEANGGVPMGVPAFQKAFGLPFQLYAPYFCSDSPYIKNWTMLRSDTGLPGCNVRGCSTQQLRSIVLV
jgi:hypothetical protein